MTDQENERNKLLINVTNNQDQSTFEVEKKEKAASGKKKKIIIAAVVGGVVAVTLILVLSLTLTGDTVAKFRPKDPPPPSAVPRPIYPIDPTQFYNQYVVGTTTNDEDALTGFITSPSYNAEHHSAVLTRLYSSVGLADNLGINPRNIPTGLNNAYIKNISFEFSMVNFKLCTLTMTDATKTRYSIPTTAVPKNGPEFRATTMRLEMLGFQLNLNPFTFSFTDVTDKTNVFLTTEDSTLVFMDKFIQMDFNLPSTNLFGFGERVHGFRLGEGTWTMWAKGQDSPVDDGTGGLQTYGVHPFILVQGKNKGDFFGMFFRNSNAQSPLIKFNADGTSKLSYITTGGQLEIYFFIHGSAKSIIQQYQNLIGNPNLPPFWALGWQQASWKYENQGMVTDMIQGYADAGIPLETVYLDIPYMKQYADFSVDTVAFPDLPGLAASLHANNQKLVVILDAGLSADDTSKNNKYYTMAQQYKTLIMSAINKDKYGGALVQKVWPDHTVFMDWFNTNSSIVWNQGLKDLFAQVPYDGLWIDMNEAWGYCSGECPNYKPDPTPAEAEEALLRNLRQEELQADPLDDTWYKSYPNQGIASTYYLPFIPGWKTGGNLDTNAMSLNATHPSIKETEYNLHNLYGLMMSKATNSFMTSKAADYPNAANRPFLLARSTFSGSGKYTSHWLGDNWRDWSYLTYSIAGIMNMNMFGIPHAGADVCGFFGEKRDDEMCARWIQLSTFYPLARAHQNLTWKGADSERSEPYYLDTTWQPIAKDAIYDRLQYLRHMYTCLFEASQWGGSCFDPLFYYYPDDDTLYDNVDSTFMVGGAIKVSPILAAGVAADAGAFTSYFPKNSGLWVNLADFSKIIDTTDKSLQDLTAQNTVNAHLRPGAMIPFQDNSMQTMKTTTDLLAAPVSLIFNRDASGLSEGTLLLDDGLTRDSITFWEYEYLKFHLSAKQITNMFAQGQLGKRVTNLDKIVIVNAKDLQLSDFACYLDAEFNPTNMTVAYDAEKLTLTISAADPLTPVTFDSFKSIQFGYSKSDINLCSPTTFQYQIKGVTDVSTIDLTGKTATFTLESLQGSLVLPDIQVTLQMVQPTIVNIQWTFVSTPKGQRTPFKVPTNIVNPVFSTKLSSLQDFVTLNASPFTISIMSLQQSKVIDFYGMVYDSWLNIVKQKVYEAPGAEYSGVFGLGERASADLPYKNGVYSMWNRDTPNPPESGKAPGNNDYGTHPFYMFRSEDSVWTGVFTNLNHAQDWYIQNDLDAGTGDITMVSVGGVVDIYVIIGYDPIQVTSDYWNYIVGRPVLTPVYALGWNQCRWGYHTTKDLQNVVDSYAKYNIPLDTQWSDIDYLLNYRDFTYDPERFEDLPDFVDSLHKKGMHYVPIVDAGIAMRPWGDYEAYDDGVAQDVFVKANFANPTTDFVGMVWPNEAVYPDWFNPATGNWWINNLQALWNDIKFDGLWLDMNEASNFCNGPCKREQVATDSALAKLKYIPSNRDLNEKSISIDAFHYKSVLEFDVHSLFGTQEVIQTNAFFAKNNKRAFIIDRSSYAGYGKYGSRWLGDNFSSMEYLEYSITGTMMMNMFGIPLVGADICGFGSDTIPELCARWTVVGAFYPFSRNHNAYDSISQEPYVDMFQKPYEGKLTYTDIMRTGIRNKYHLIRYYYTQMFMASVYGTGPLFNPLFFNFPNDKNAFNDVHQNIMLGPSLKLSANTNKLNSNSTKFYFPEGTWCNVFNAAEKCIVGSEGQFVDLRTKAYDFYLHLYEGNILPMQNATAYKINTTSQLKNYPVDFHILGTLNRLGFLWYSAGNYINDDGEIADINGNYNHYALAAMQLADQPDSFQIQLTQYYSAYNYLNKTQGGCNGVNKNDFLGDIYVYNAQSLNIGNSYKVQFIAQNATAYDIGTATYDAKTDRVVFTNKFTKTPVCLTTVAQIVFTKAT